MLYNNFFLIPLLLFVINNSSCSIEKLSHELLVEILGCPDRQTLNEIINTQREIESQRRLVFNEWCSEPFITESTIKQKTFIEIRNALFPCFIFLRTCKAFYAHEQLKINIQNKATEKLAGMIPQGIGLFLLPKPLQNSMPREYYTEKGCWNKSIAPQELIVQTCYQHRTIEWLHEKLTLLNINEIIYEPMNDNTALAYTVLEYILYRQASHTHYYRPPTPEQEQFFLKVFENVCLLQNIDLTLPAAQSEENIATHIYNLLVIKGNPSTLISKEALDKINVARKIPTAQPLLEDPILVKKIVQKFFDPHIETKKLFQKKSVDQTLINRLKKFFRLSMTQQLAIITVVALLVFCFNTPKALLQSYIMSWQQKHPLLMDTMRLY